MTIHEPATFLTDCVLAALAATLAWRLRVAGPAAGWWRRAFVLIAVSAIVGGTYHGFAPHAPEAARSLWWFATLATISGVSACLLLSLIHEMAPVGRIPLWRGIVTAKLIVALLVAAARPEFIVAIADYGLALGAWLLASLRVARPWRGWMLAGIGLSAAAAVVQQSDWPRLTHFNHNDLYHLIQALGLIAFFQGARRLGMSN